MNCDYLLSTIYNFAEPPKKKKVPKLSEVTRNSRARQELILALIIENPMTVREICDRLECKYENTRQDVRSLISRGKAENLSHGMSSKYLVRAV
jgi:predicted HTH transcriptional regulator